MKFLSIGHLTYDNYIFLENFPVEGSKNVSKKTQCVVVAQLTMLLMH